MFLEFFPKLIAKCIILYFVVLFGASIRIIVEILRANVEGFYEICLGEKSLWGVEKLGGGGRDL